MIRWGISNCLWFAFFSLAPLMLLAQETPNSADKNPEPVSRVHWQRGPVQAHLGDLAELKLPAGYLFADAENTKTLLEETQNIPNGRELGALAAINDSWFAIFEFDSVGYVKDDEKDKLDADAILKNIQQATEEGNKEREKRGWGTFTITNWIDPPHYNSQTHRLDWSIVGHDEKGAESANYRTRFLGRRGVMSVELVVGPQRLAAVLPRFSSLTNDSFSFTPDNKYTAFVKGDKVAEYGLTALILGGAAAAAVKTGLFKYLIKLAIVGWKAIALGLAAIGAFIKRLFTRKPAETMTETGSEI